VSFTSFRSTPKETAWRIHWAGGWVGLTTDLKAVAKRKKKKSFQYPC